MRSGKKNDDREKEPLLRQWFFLSVDQKQRGDDLNSGQILGNRL